MLVVLETLYCYSNRHKSLGPLKYILVAAVKSKINAATGNYMVNDALIKSFRLSEM